MTCYTLTCNQTEAVAQVMRATFGVGSGGEFIAGLVGLIVMAALLFLLGAPVEVILPILFLCVIAFVQVGLLPSVLGWIMFAIAGAVVAFALLKVFHR